MSRPLRGALLVVAVIAALACGGCHGATAAPGSTGTVPAAGSADPDGQLSSVESSLDTIERQIDRDGAG